jgi:bifunctional non-homologous end joining protein LigD
VSLLWRPQPLLRVAEPFDHPDWLFELKHDGFRALARVDHDTCTLVSRRGHVFQQWPQLAEELAHSVRARKAVLDGEIVCLRPDGNSDFNALLFRRESPYYYAFDVLSVDGEDLRGLPLLERKRRLHELIPFVPTRLRYVDHLERRGVDLFRAVCRADAEGIVAKWTTGAYHCDGLTTSWVKVKNRAYSQMEGRHELFAERGRGRRGSRPSYRFDRTAAAAWSSSLANPGRSHQFT